MKKIEKSIELGGRTLTLSSGQLAQQATGSVLAKYGETVVLATVVAAPLKVDLGYFPLTVEYQERLYAGGRIKGSRWVKREGRPSDEEILAGRLIDRSVRPFFPSNYKKDVQVMITVLSVDIANDPKTLAAVAVSAALAISSIPWQGPVGTLQVGKKNGSFFTNPLDSEMPFSELDLVVSATKEAIVMIEAEAKEVPEEGILGAIEYGQQEAGKIIDFIVAFAKEVGTKKEDLLAEKSDEALKLKVKKLIEGKLEDLVKVKDEEIKSALVSELAEEDPARVAAVFEKLFKEKVRAMILSGKRADGRKLDEVRPLDIEVGVLPRTHGSAIFQRGQSQVLTVTTLGAPSMEQLIESAEGEESKRYIHHYSMPPYSTGETGRVGFPSRRDIGHGALVERALGPVIPTEDKFPYTIRVVSEVLSSNGSTSMASVCGSTLSLMDAGVPISSPVSGIAIGAVLESPKKYAILSDILGLEDFMGDMDFKIAGTAKGITAMQLDVKTLNLTTSILKEVLSLAKEGRVKILKAMLKILPQPRANVSAFAPKIKVIKVLVEKIGEVIGPGGKTIRKIIADSGAQVEVEDDGSINISGTTAEAVEKAAAIVEGLTKQVTAGEIYEGEVKRIQSFGAFVEILPGKEGLVHVSDMGQGYVADPSQVVSTGQKVKVRVKEIDDLGRINLSMRMDPATDKPREKRDSGERRGFSSRGGPASGWERRPRYGQNRGFDRGRRQPSSGGPHFPTSRFIDEGKKDFNR